MEAKSSKPVPNVLDLILDTVFVVDEDGMIVSASGGCEQMLGYAPSELAGRRMLDFVAPEDIERTIKAARGVAGGSPHLHFENRYVRRDGSLVDLMWSAKWCEEQRVRIGVARDMTALKGAESLRSAIHDIAEATLANDTMEGLMERLGALMRSALRAGSFAFALRGAPDQTGVFGSIDHGVAAARALDLLDRMADERALAGGAAMSARVVNSGRDSEAGPGAGSGGSWLALPLMGADGLVGAAFLAREAGEASFGPRELAWADAIGAHVAIAVDRCAMRARMARAASRDELTGLANRAVFHERLSRALSEAGQPGSVALLFMDLDAFKGVNDTLGHDGGDQVLREFAERVARAAGERSLAARLGGDEFAVLVAGSGARERALQAADALREGMREPIDAGGARVSITSSIGLASYPEDGSDPAQMLRAADKAMYAAKALAAAQRRASQEQAPLGEAQCAMARAAASQ